MILSSCYQAELSKKQTLLKEKEDELVKKNQEISDVHDKLKKATEDFERTEEELEKLKEEKDKEPVGWLHLYFELTFCNSSTFLFWVMAYFGKPSGGWVQISTQN